MRRCTLIISSLFIRVVNVIFQDCLLRQNRRRNFLLALTALSYCYTSAQKNEGAVHDSLSLAKQTSINAYKQQRDVSDLVLLLLHKDPDKRLNNYASLATKPKISAGPILEYTLATGFTAGIAANGAFATVRDTVTNISSVLVEVKYTQKHQFLLPVQTSIWLPRNKYNLLGDWRYLNYPQDTYGFGGHTTEADVSVVTYQYIRLYEYLLRRIANNLYGGVGYQLDRHWGITQLDVPPGAVTDFTRYGFSSRSTSSGIGINLIYDSRKNAINPEGGSFYTRLAFLQNSTALGSNTNWNAFSADIRKYIRLSPRKVLALWCYSVFTLHGDPPYLDLPGTGSDTYNNTGRGYETGRFIGKKMIDLEAELRFGITANGLVGGVVFANAESLSELYSNKFEVISPACGIGLRIKFNKFSNTNTCIDYGVGSKGSHGFFGNLGEVF